MSSIGSSIYIDTSKNSDESRTMHGVLGTAPYVSSLAIQYNRWDNWQAVPANDGTIIRPVGVLWIFKQPSRPWHGSVFLWLFARFRDQLINVLLRRVADASDFHMRRDSTQGNFFLNPRRRTITFRCFLFYAKDSSDFRNVLSYHSFKKFEIKVKNRLF